MCGSVDVWKCMCKSGNMQMSRYLTHFYLNSVVWKSEVWKSESVEVQKCWSVEMWKCGSAQIWKYANESLPYSHLSWLGSVEVWKCGSVEVWKWGNLQICKWVFTLLTLSLLGSVEVRKVWIFQVITHNCLWLFALQVFCAWYVDMCLNNSYSLASIILVLSYFVAEFWW